MSTYKYFVDTDNRGDLIQEFLERRTRWQSLKRTWTTIQENHWNLVWKTTVNFIPNFKGPNYKFLKPFIGKNESGKVNLFNLPKVPGSLKIINHFPNPDVITRKTELFRSLKNKVDFLPETYILNFKDGPDKFLKNYSEGEIYILKPEYQHSGKGIYLFDSLEGITKYFETEIVELENSGFQSGFGSNPNFKSPEWVIQKYIKNPFLLEGRKFDIRINVLVTKNMDIYVSPFGFIRTVSDQYVPYLSGDFEKDKFIHITNHAVQMYSKNYSLKEEGNVMSLSQFQTYLDLTYGKNKINIYRDFFPQWNEIIIKTILSGSEKMHQAGISFKNRKDVEYFELLGFDILLDETGKSWLLEVNTNPGLEQDNSWAIHIVRNMLEELAQICIDPFFPSPKTPYHNNYLPPSNLRWESEIKPQLLSKEFRVSNNLNNKPFDFSKAWNLIYRKG